MLIFFLILLFALSIAVLFQKRLLNSVILLGVFSLVSSVIYYFAGAPDVAVTEGAIGVAFVTFIYVLALSDQGKLHVLAEEIPPFLFQEKGKLKGIEYEILEEFANSMDLDLEVEFVSHEKLISQSSNQIADIVAGAFLKDFSSSSNLSTTKSFHKEQLAKVKSTNRKGEIGTLHGISPPESTGKGADKFEIFSSLDDLVKAYSKKRIAGFVADSARITSALKKIDAPLQSESEITKIGEVEYCFALANTEDDLRKQLNQHLNKMRNSRKLDRLLSNYIGGKQ